MLVGTVMVRSMDQGLRTHEAMVARNYTGQMPYGPVPAMRRADRWVTVAGALVVPTVYALVEWGPR